MVIYATRAECERICYALQSKFDDVETEALIDRIQEVMRLQCPKDTTGWNPSGEGVLGC